MASVILLFALLYLTNTPSEAQSDTTFINNFNSELGDLIVAGGVWRWADTDSLGYKVPDGKNGFAVYDIPGDGDELYSDAIPLDYGLNYSIVVFVSAQSPRLTHFELHQLSKSGVYSETIKDYTYLSNPINQDWFYVTGTVDPTPDALFSMYCQTDYSNPNGTEGYIWGCAVDSVTIITGTAPTTTTSTTTTSTTTTSTTTTSTTTTSTTTAKPLPPQIDFNFTTGTAGWVLGNSNGAAWQRVRTSGVYGIDVTSSQVISGVVLAVSPRLVVSADGVLDVAVTFSVTGSEVYPAYLSVRRATSYTTFGAEPFLTLDAYGITADASYFSETTTVAGAGAGDEFFIVLEGSLGIDQTNTISVREVQVTGATLAPVTEAEFFDFSGGLVGWTQGNIDGGRWQVVDYAGSSLDIPAPSGDYILVVDRFDIHSGVVAIESPPLSTAVGTVKTFSATAFVRGSAEHPVSLRIRVKTLDGEYDAQPFLDLIDFGTSASPTWQKVSGTFRVIQEYFQLVIEADLGRGSDNAVAIDEITVTSA